MIYQNVSLFNKLFPIHRSILGPGIRQSLEIIADYVKILKIKKIKSGTQVFDWKVPNEWHIEDAYIITPKGKKFVI